MAIESRDLDVELAGLDALEALLDRRPSLARRIWAQVWPKLAAIAIGLFLWQLVVWSGWKPEYLLPGPKRVLPELWHEMGRGRFWTALGNTLSRAGWGFVFAGLIGSVVGVAVARVNVLRIAVGSMITGLQTMPSVTWYPLAILLFAVGDGAIMFVVVLGAAPSIANGIIAGVDHVPPLLLRSGRMLGARGFKTYRHVIIPAALPSFVGGLKQGWAFAWRSLLAGELIAQVGGRYSIGGEMEFARTFNDTPVLIGYMIVLLFLGIVIDQVFSQADLRLRKRWGLIDAATD